VAPPKYAVKTLPPGKVIDFHDEIAVYYPAWAIALFAQDDSGHPLSREARHPDPAAPPREQARSMIVTRYRYCRRFPVSCFEPAPRSWKPAERHPTPAIACNAVLGLTQPYVNGVGGEPVRNRVRGERPAKVYGLNSSGWTPKALTIDYLKGKKIEKIDRIGVHAITVPGLRRGMDAAASPFWHEILTGTGWAPPLYARERVFHYPIRGA